MQRYSAEVERDLSISPLPDEAPPASAVLERGAQGLGWSVLEVPRWYRYERGDDGGHRAVKQTMTRTFVPRALAAGARLMPGCAVRRLVIRGGRVREARCVVERADGTREPLTIAADEVFVCAGAIGTPALLQRSGVRRRIGAGLKLHPTIKLAARFPEPFADHSYVPMHQVKEFAPDVTLGGSAFRPGYVALALGDSWAENEKDMADWERIGVYYASIRSDGAGRVIAVPGLDSPVVTYALRESDLSRLARGLVHLGELLFEAGADTLYPSIEGARAVRHPDQLADLWSQVRRDRVSLMTIHLFSTVGMGERRDRTGADSFGRVWGVGNLRVNDASLLPDAPGVNPQGTIMAIAARNCDQFLSGS
jgi:choline dehydrogenase-like flavoprotein